MEKLISKLLFVILFSLLQTNIYAQYKLVNEINTDVTFPKNSRIDEVGFEVNKNTICLVQSINDTSSENGNRKHIVISFHDLNSGNEIQKDTIQGITSAFRVYDIDFNDKYCLLVGHKKYLYYERNNTQNAHFVYLPKEILNNKGKSIAFKNANIINDSLALLHGVYNYHPNSSGSGLHLNILNLNTNTIVKSVSYDFPGIGISFMSHSWITVSGGYIYAVSPLSTWLHIYDKYLNLVKKKQLKLFDANSYAKNILYEQYVDSIIKYENIRIEKIVNKYDKDSLEYHREDFQSYIYSKEYIGSTLDSLHGAYNSVNRIFTVNDSIIAVTTATPHDRNVYRNLFLLNKNSLEIVKKIDKWRISPTEEQNKVEDFFVLDISIQDIASPKFKDGYIYTCGFYPTSIFVKDNVKKSADNVFNYIKNHGYKWTILKYKIDN
ncbi:MAG: hypothetical protein R2800_00925 [Flavipsychrobacter sp.]